MSRCLFILSSIVLYLWSIRRGSSRPERLFQSASLQAARNDHPHKSPGCEADVTSAWSTEPSIYGPDVEFSIRRHQRRWSGSLVLLSIFLLSVSFCVFFFPPQNLTFLKTRQFEGFFLVRSTVNKPVQSNRVPVVVLFSPPPGDNNGVYRFDWLSSEIRSPRLCVEMIGAAPVKLLQTGRLMPRDRRFIDASSRRPRTAFIASFIHGAASLNWTSDSFFFFFLCCCNSHPSAELLSREALIKHRDD